MSKELNLEAIIFDMDGLMFDTENISFISWQEAAVRHGYQIHREIFYKTIGANLIRTKDIYVKHFGESFPFEKIIEERLRIAEEIIISKGVPVKKGLYELLDFLKERNIKKAVATSTSRERALNLLSLAKVEKSFDYILCGNEITNSKPHPEIFLTLSNRLKCSPERCLVLEDSDVGIIASHRAGMLPIMIPDMKEPEGEVEGLAFRRMCNLLEVKWFLEECLQN